MNGSVLSFYKPSPRGVGLIIVESPIVRLPYLRTLEKTLRLDE